MTKLAILLLCCNLGPVQALAQIQNLSAVQLNKEGAALLQLQNHFLAQEKFLKALALEPFSPALHLNLGVAFEAQGQMEKAEASYQTALKLSQGNDSHSIQVRFLALFNLGQLAGKAKKVDQALEFYQQALLLKPNSQETKVNIELLTQQNGGSGEGEGDDKKDQDKDKDKKDKKGKGDQDQKKDEQKDKDGDKDKDKPKEYEKKSKPQPQKFKSEELTQGDVNKILGEIKQQEQKIRQDYNRKEVKEKPRGKDW